MITCTIYIDIIVLVLREICTESNIRRGLVRFYESNFDIADNLDLFNN